MENRPKRKGLQSIRAKNVTMSQNNLVLRTSLLECFELSFFIVAVHLRLTSLYNVTEARNLLLVPANFAWCYSSFLQEVAVWALHLVDAKRYGLSIDCCACQTWQGNIIRSQPQPCMNETCYPQHHFCRRPKDAEQVGSGKEGKQDVSVC